MLNENRVKKKFCLSVRKARLVWVISETAGPIWTGISLEGTEGWYGRAYYKLFFIF